MTKKDKPQPAKGQKKHPHKPADVPYPNHHPAYVVASWFWVGKLRPASGTWGTLAAVPLWYALFTYSSQMVYTGVLVALFLCGALAINQIEKKIGREKSHDASVFVIDEVVGMGLTLLPLYLILESETVASFPYASSLFFIYGFLMFRLCDVLKPWPISWVDKKINNGWGVMLDDVLAGFLAAMLLYFGFTSWGLTYYAIAEGYIPAHDIWFGLALMFGFVHIPVLCGYLILYGLVWLWRWIQKFFA